MQNIKKNNDPIIEQYTRKSFFSQKLPKMAKIYKTRIFLKKGFKVAFISSRTFFPHAKTVKTHCLSYISFKLTYNAVIITKHDTIVSRIYLVLSQDHIILCGHYIDTNVTFCYKCIYLSVHDLNLTYNFIILSICVLFVCSYF